RNDLAAARSVRILTDELCPILVEDLELEIHIGHATQDDARDLRPFVFDREAEAIAVGLLEIAPMPHEAEDRPATADRVGSLEIVVRFNHNITANHLAAAVPSATRAITPVSSAIGTCVQGAAGVAAPSH